MMKSMTDKLVLMIILKMIIMAGCSDYHQDCDHDGDNTNDGTGDDHDGGGGDGHVSNVYHHDDDGNNMIMIIMVLGEGVMMTIKMTMMTLS